MMMMQKVIPYTDNPQLKFRAIGIPYQSSRASMFIVLPYEGQLLADTIKKLQPQQLREIVDAARNNRSLVEYKLPRTKMSWNQDLNQELISLGCKKIFNSPNLSKMLVDSGLSVSAVQHVTTLDLDENGVIASAVTHITFLKKGVANFGVPSLPFYVDRPFMFFIYHPETKMPLFVGQVYNPLGK